MKGKRIALLTAFGAMMAVAPAFAQPYIFPNSGQSDQQQAMDKGSCESWAQQQTGYNPLASSAPPPSSQQGVGVLGGAARGAAGGAIIGAIAGNAGKGAAIGAAGGGLFGGMRRQDQQRQDAAARSNYDAQQQQARSQYLRAFGACMEGKDYTVK